MGKKPGRPRKNKLADMGIYPPEGGGYCPPPPEECEEHPITIDIEPGSRLNARMVCLRGRDIVVEFSISQWVRRDGPWQEVARIDTAHGTIHRHQFTRKGDERIVHLELIPPDRGEEAVTRWWDLAMDRMQNEWVDSLRRWHDDRQ